MRCSMRRAADVNHSDERIVEIRKRVDGAT